jgi:LysM repeat protein
MALLFIGCEKEKKEAEHDSITINKIEKKITNQETNLGCEGNHSKSLESECRDDKNSAQFILSTLEKDLETTPKKSDMVSIKHNLNLSLEEITKEEHQKNKLKESLIALVNEVDESKDEKRTKLKSFVDGLDDTEMGISQHKKIAFIKDGLMDLVDSEHPKVQSKEVKEKLENLISEVVDSEKSLMQTQVSLKHLVDSVDDGDSSSTKKFVSAIIEDVSTKKITILDESQDFFTIKVQKGDNLSILAKRYYNDKNKFKLIYNANRDKINKKYEIYPNSTLLIPKI